MLSKFLVNALLLLTVVRSTVSLDNGLAMTPPMGWMSWERFRCITDCQQRPNECISERLFREIADRMVEDEYSKVGYEYVIIDDCWLASERDENGLLQPDPERFPSGIRNLSDYIHSKGLKFGIYEDIGTKTCAGYPGLQDHYELDAQTMADWGVDYIKVDGCNFNPEQMGVAYPEFGRRLLETNRPIVYSANWAVSEYNVGIQTNFSALAYNLNLWRNWIDVEDSWNSVSSIIDYFAENQDSFAQFAGPGHWNDPDMLIVGNYGLSYEQAKAQMAIWAILAAPLIMSHDLRAVRSEYREILLNHDVILVNQDPLGIPGRRVYAKNDIEVWTRPVQSSDGSNSYAVAVLSKRTDGAPYLFEIPLAQIGLDNSYRFVFTELFGAVEDSEIAAEGTLSALVAPTGVLLFKAQVKRNFTSL